MKVKVRGVYDLELFRYLKSVGVSHFAFDLRPASFNFVQAHKIVEMLELGAGGEETFSFVFASEKDFVIEQLTGFIRQRCALPEENFLLEFADAENLQACEKFRLPYIWHFKENSNCRKIKEARLLRGISFSYSFLEGLRDSSGLYSFIKEFSSMKRGDQWIDLRLDWSDHLSESVIDFFPANTLSYEINQKVENSYRKVNMNLVSSHLDHARRTLNLDV